MMWAEVRPGVTKGDAPSLCPALLVLVLHPWSTGKGLGEEGPSESDCEDERSACHSSSAGRTESCAECDTGCELMALLSE